MVGDSYTYPAWLLVSTDTSLTAVASTATSLSGEVGSRMPITATQTGREVNYAGTRTPAAVIETTSGDTLTAAGLSSASSGTDLHVGAPVAAITQTTNFNIEIDWTILWE